MFAITKQAHRDRGIIAETTPGTVSPKPVNFSLKNEILANSTRNDPHTSPCKLNIKLIKVKSIQKTHQNINKILFYLFIYLTFFKNNIIII